MKQEVVAEVRQGGMVYVLYTPIYEGPNRLSGDRTSPPRCLTFLPHCGAVAHRRSAGQTIFPTSPNQLRVPSRRPSLRYLLRQRCSKPVKIAWTSICHMISLSTSNEVAPHYPANCSDAFYSCQCLSSSTGWNRRRTALMLGNHPLGFFLAKLEA
jgi:hypothetical protein